MATSFKRPGKPWPGASREAGAYEFLPFGTPLFSRRCNVPNLSRRSSSWVADILASIAVLSGVGYLLGAYTLSRWITRPSRGRPHLPPSEPNNRCEDVECQTIDGLRLAGWVMTPPQPKATVVLFHGFRQNRAQ